MHRVFSFPNKLKSLSISFEDLNLAEDGEVQATDVDAVIAHTLKSGRARDPFVGDYKLKDLLENLEASGIFPAIRAKGFNNLRLDVDTSDPFVHLLQVYDTVLDSNNVLIQFFVRKNLDYDVLISRAVNDRFECGHSCIKKNLAHGLKFILIEWLRLQDPRRTYPTKGDLVTSMRNFKNGNIRTALPGQFHPGLAIGTLIDNLLIQLATRNERDGLVNCPEYWHNAFMYRSRYMFLNPVFQGFVDTLNEDLEKEMPEWGLCSVAWAVVQGYVLDTATVSPEHPRGTPVKWETEEQICPISRRMKQFFSMREYRRLRKQNHTPGRFIVDWPDIAETGPVAASSGDGPAAATEDTGAKNSEDMETEQAAGQADQN